MQVIGTVGLPGSGKGEVANVAAEEDVPVVTMGDVIRRECRERGLDPAEHHGQVANDLRDEHGPAAIAERSLPLVEEAAEEGETVLVDGLRSPVEVEAFRERFGADFAVAAIEVPFEQRAERLAERGRVAEDESREKLRERDDRERGWGVDDVMADADVTIDNTGTLTAFRQKSKLLLRHGPERLAADRERDGRGR